MSYKKIDGTTYVKAMEVVKWLREKTKKEGNLTVEELINDILELHIKCLEESRK